MDNMVNEYDFFCKSCKCSEGEFLGFIIEGDKKFSLHKCTKCRKQRRDKFNEVTKYA